MLTLNVRDFGAKGDDVSDDTVAIRAAIVAAVAAKGGVIYLPAGSYRVCPQQGDPLPSLNGQTTKTPYGDIFHLASSGLAFIGDGRDNTFIKGMCFGMKDPMTSWVKTGDPSNYVKIGRFTLFGIFSTAQTGPLTDFTFGSLTLDGGAGYTGNFTVGGIPATGDGWDMRHCGVRISGPVPVTNIDFSDCDVKNFRGEVIWAGGPNIGRMSIRNTSIRGSNASALSVSSDVTLDSSQIGGPNLADSVQNGCENYAIGPGQKTVIQNGSTIQAHSNGVVYIGPPAGKLSITDSSLVGNGKAVLLSEQAYDVSILRNKFMLNKNAVITSLLNLYPQMTNKGFGNIQIDSNVFDRSGGVLISQPGKLNDVSITNNQVGTGCQLLSGDFTGTTEFHVSNNALSAGSKDAASRLIGRVALWRGNTRPAAPQLINTCFNKYDQQTSTPVVMLLAFTTDAVYLNSVSRAPQIVAFDPTVLANCPEGHTFIMYVVGNGKWVLQTDSTNTLVSNLPLAQGTLQCAVTGGKVTVKV